MLHVRPTRGRPAAFRVVLLSSLAMACASGTAPDDSAPPTFELPPARRYELVRIDGETLPLPFGVLDGDSIFLFAETIDIREGFASATGETGPRAGSALPVAGFYRRFFRAGVSGDSIALEELAPCSGTVCTGRRYRGVIGDSTLTLADSLTTLREYRRVPFTP